MWQAAALALKTGSPECASCVGAYKLPCHCAQHSSLGPDPCPPSLALCSPQHCPLSWQLPAPTYPACLPKGSTSVSSVLINPVTHPDLCLPIVCCLHVMDMSLVVSVGRTLVHTLLLPAPSLPLVPQLVTTVTGVNQGPKLWLPEKGLPLQGLNRTLNTAAIFSQLGL